MKFVKDIQRRYWSAFDQPVAVLPFGIPRAAGLIH